MTPRNSFASEWETAEKSRSLYMCRSIYFRLKCRACIRPYSILAVIFCLNRIPLAVVMGMCSRQLSSTCRVHTYANTYVISLPHSIAQVCDSGLAVLIMIVFFNRSYLKYLCNRPLMHMFDVESQRSTHCSANLSRNPSTPRPHFHFLYPPKSALPPLGVAHDQLTRRRPEDKRAHLEFCHVRRRVRVPSLLFAKCNSYEFFRINHS
ncbi:hypothetical protein BDR06DRAFT_791575 [Suillus hirtellus]|nr:hypothetical protein BDR06DRAFT_791575 [Suillus hirtellus]